MAENVRIEWGVEWTEAEEDYQRYEDMSDEPDGGEAHARRVAKQYHGDGARLVRREVRAGSWTEAERW